MGSEIRVFGIEGMPKAVEGDDLAAKIMDACSMQGIEIERGILVVTQKLFQSKGRVTRDCFP
ncbi:MAG: hypothetical protein Ct9H300mP27_11930 [Chloroflexota bacterium]|nr:MAG: hypothetical protein Ct9H300mP27_11930 [Chloroflexota bacterium]